MIPVICGDTGERRLERIGAMTILGALCLGDWSQLADGLDELIQLLTHRFRLVGTESAWCVEILTQAGQDPMERSKRVARLLPVLDPGDASLLHGFLEDFGGASGSGAAFRAALASAGFMGPFARTLFPPSIRAAFDLLDIAPTFRVELIQRAFRASMVLLHPDIASTALLESRELQAVEGLVKRITCARANIMEHVRSFTSE